MVGSNEGTDNNRTGSDRNISGNNQQLFGYLAKAQRNVGPLDIKTEEGRMLKEAGWVDDRGFINEQGISKSFTGQNSMSGPNRS